MVGGFASVVTRVKALSDAHLPHTAVLEQGARAYEPGGTRGGITWDPDGVWTEAARFSPAGVPQERITAGALTTTSDHVVKMRTGVAPIPADVGDTYYRIRVEHDLTEIPSPFYLYRPKVRAQSYRAMTTVIGTTEAPK